MQEHGRLQVDKVADIPQKETHDMQYRHLPIVVAVTIASAFSPAYGQTTEGQSVAAAIERVATGLAGRIGFAAQEIGGNEVIAFNGDESFAMASTYKVAIATAVLDRVDRGNSVSTNWSKSRRTCTSPA